MPDSDDDEEEEGDKENIPVFAKNLTNIYMLRGVHVCQRKFLAAFMVKPKFVRLALLKKSKVLGTVKNATKPRGTSNVTPVEKLDEVDHFMNRVREILINLIGTYNVTI